ncbi:hypothetical protein M7I_5604 [Glarea lozoyensis 74030]|nr:hypothetical protein M7I_5604 [Glarea lozoyensis 74030]
MANQIVLPSWVLIIRGLQLLLAIVILGMASYGAYWLRLSSWGWTIFTSLATVFIVVYSVLPERVAALQKIYNPFAVLAANATAVVFWLAAMGALAARRATFKYATTIESCYNDGSGGVCARGLEKRAAYVATWPYLNMMSACAGLCAIEM